MKNRSKHKDFWVIAYDVASDLRRSRIAKLMEKNGVRVNCSVFECFLTEREFERLQKKINSLADPREDNIIYYPLCLACYSKIQYFPKREVRPKVVTLI